MQKNSEQQIYPKVLSVANSCHYNENSKKCQKSFMDKCSPLVSYPKKSPPAKARMQNPRVGADFLCKSPGVRGGVDVLAKIDSCIIPLIQHKLG